MSKVTLASNTSGFESSVPPKPKGVKPKAKLRSLHATCETSRFRYQLRSLRLHHKLELVGSRNKRGRPLPLYRTSEPRAKGKQKQSEKTGTTFQRKTASQVKNVSASSQQQMPPPDSKPDGKTRSARSSQLTDGIEDSEVPEEPKLLSQGN